MVKNRDFNDVFSYLEKQDLGSRWFPEIPQHIYTFKDEVPWCDTFAYNGKSELNFVVGQKPKKTRIEKPDEQTNEYEVEIPVSSLGWESYHSVVNQGYHAYVLSKELCEFLELSSRPQTFDLYDKNDRTASITLKWGEESHTFQKLIYIRKDLLENYLENGKLELIWAMWGERLYQSKHNEGLREFAEKYKSYQGFQKIIAYRDIIQA